MILDKSFYESKNTIKIARGLLGCFLVRKTGGKIYRMMISETEAYHGPKDLASHASRGKTRRNSVMFGPGGFFYVYFVYGMHHMLNVVTGPEEYPAAVLIRGAISADDAYQGPARLTKALGIGRDFNGLPAFEKKYGLWIEGRKNNDFAIVKRKRIGVDYAGEYRGKLWNFCLAKASRKKPAKG